MALQDTLNKPMADPFGVASKQRAASEAVAGAEANIAQQTTERMEPIIAAERQKMGEIGERQAQIGEQLQKPFEVPKETIGDFAQLGGLVAMAGVMLGASGKQSANNVLGAMTGIMEGYKSGRKDLIANSYKEFDTNMKRLQGLQKSIDSDLQMYLKLSATDREQASLYLSQAKAKAGQGIAGVVADGQSADKVANLQMQIKQMGQSAQQHKDRIDMEKNRILAEQEKAKITPAYTGPDGTMYNAKGEVIPVPKGLTKITAKPPAVAGEVGNSAELQRLLPDKKVTLNEKDAKPIVEGIYATGRLANFIDKANDPDINYGEISRISNRAESFLKRNTTGAESPQETQALAERATNAAVKELGLNPNDKNIVFYKEAIFNIMEAERAIRGGSILPVAIMQRLTPLMDPANMNREQFIEIMKGNLQRVAQSTRLQPDVLKDAIGKIQTFDYEVKKYDTAPQSSAKPAYLNNREIVVKNGKWVYKDTGEVAQ